MLHHEVRLTLLRIFEGDFAGFSGFTTTSHKPRVSQQLGSAKCDKNPDR